MKLQFMKKKRKSNYSKHLLEEDEFNKTLIVTNLQSSSGEINWENRGEKLYARVGERESIAFVYIRPIILRLLFTPRHVCFEIIVTY